MGEVKVVYRQSRYHAALKRYNSRLAEEEALQDELSDPNVTEGRAKEISEVLARKYP